MNQASATTRTTIKLLLIVVAMFGFGFALVPLYNIICQITGLNGKTSGPYVPEEFHVVNENRTVKIQFIANNNAGMPWEFRPVRRSLEVKPGAQYTTHFFARNLANKRIVAQAVPSVTPFQAAQYLHKTECFCFEQQTLSVGESLDMPLRFIIDSHLPEAITTLTLAYTIYDITDQANGDLAAN